MNNNFVFNLKNKLSKTYSRISTDEVTFSPSGNAKNLRLSDCTVEDILPHLLVNSSMATIGSKEKNWVATSMLARFLETFTNNLVVMENEVPVGMLGSQEVIKELLKNPTREFFSDCSVEQMMSTNLYVTNPSTKFHYLLETMERMQRDFALIRNTRGHYSTISARRLLEVYVLCDTRIKVSDLPLKCVQTFNRDDDIGTIMERMIKNNSEILLLENTPKFVNPQIIFEKIVRSNFLDGIDSFFDLKASTLELQNGKIISGNTTVPEICKTMLKMKYSFVITSNNVLTPWDLILALR